MPLLDFTGPVADPWVNVADADPLPPGRDVIVSLDRLLASADADHGGRLGVVLGAEDDVGAIVPLLDRLALVVLAFPALTDGRHYSNAMLLATRHGYAGEIRAAGAIDRDRAHFLARCGFTTFELADDVDTEGFLRGLRGFPYAYQTAADGAVPVYRRRRGPRAQRLSM